MLRDSVEVDGFFGSDGRLWGLFSEVREQSYKSTERCETRDRIVVIGGTPGPCFGQLSPVPERRVSSSRVTSRESRTTG